MFKYCKKVFRTNKPNTDKFLGTNTAKSKKQYEKKNLRMFLHLLCHQSYSGILYMVVKTNVYKFELIVNHNVLYVV